MDPSEAQRFYKSVSVAHLEKGPEIVDNNKFLSVFVMAKDNWGTPSNVILIRHKILGVEEVLNMALAMAVLSTTLAALFSLYVPKILDQNYPSNPRSQDKK